MKMQFRGMRRDEVVVALLVVLGFLLQPGLMLSLSFFLLFNRKHFISSFYKIVLLFCNIITTLATLL